MPKPLKQTEEKEQIVTSQFYRDLARDHYNEALDMEEEGGFEQKKIDAAWGLAAKNFWMAFALGHKEAPFGLFKCFVNGVGVVKDSLLAAYMYGVAKKLEDPKCQKLDVEDIPVIYRSMQPAIDQIATWVMDTQKKFPKGVSHEILFTQMEAYDDKIGLLTGKLMMASFMNKDVAQKQIARFHDDHPGWKYLGLGDEAEFADPVDDAGAAAAAGVTALHFDDHQG